MSKEEIGKETKEIAEKLLEKAKERLGIVSEAHAKKLEEIIKEKEREGSQSVVSISSDSSAPLRKSSEKSSEGPSDVSTITSSSSEDVSEISVPASILLDKPFQRKMEQVRDKLGHQMRLTYARYGPIFQQKCVQILGRTIDVPSLLTEQLNIYIRENIDQIISRYESSTITAALEIDHLMRTLKLTVEMLREELPGIDPFDVRFLFFSFFVFMCHRLSFFSFLP